MLPAWVVLPPFILLIDVPLPCHAHVLQPTPGGRLSMFGGSIQGEFRELQPPNRLVLGWRFSNWEESCMSQVRCCKGGREEGVK